jgi:hypothetical protein
MGNKKNEEPIIREVSQEKDKVGTSKKNLYLINSKLF